MVIINMIHKYSKMFLRFKRLVFSANVIRSNLKLHSLCSTKYNREYMSTYNSSKKTYVFNDSFLGFKGNPVSLRNVIENQT